MLVGVGGGTDGRGGAAQAALEQLKEVVHDERLHGAQPAVKPKRRKPAATATSRPADGGAPFAAWQTAIRESMQRRL